MGGKMTWNVVIYGTNLYPPPNDGSYPSKDTISAQTDIDYFEIKALEVNAKPALDGDAVEYVTSWKNFLGTYRYEFEIKFVFQFPSTAIDADDFFGSKIFKKKYLYLWIDIYTIRPEKIGTNDLVIPVFVSSIEVANQKGFKVVTLKLEEIGVAQ
jgi:hypothetical protein